MNGAIIEDAEKNIVNKYKKYLKKSLQNYDYPKLIQSQCIYLDTLIHDFELIYYFVNNLDKLKEDFYFRAFEIPRETISCVIQNGYKIRVLETPNELITGSVRERVTIEDKFNKDIQYLTSYHIEKISDLFNIYRKFIVDKRITIKKCKNCGKYFIPESRTDEVYCNRISPQNHNKTCKEYGAKKTYREEIKSTPIKYEHNKISQFYRMRINRAKEQSEKTLYEKQFNTYKENYQKKKEQYKSGRLNETTFVEWIKTQRNIT